MTSGGKAISDWFTWTGGEMPVGARQPVEVRRRDTRRTTRRMARAFAWNHQGDNTDIVAYRLLAPALPASEVDAPREPD